MDSGGVAMFFPCFSKFGRVVRISLFLFFAAICPAADIESLLKAYEQASKPHEKNAALSQILSDYPSYKSYVAQQLASGGKSPDFSRVTREIDEHIVRMTQETWQTVLKNDPGAVTHIVPVGSLGDRLTNPAYIPGKSDKDMIPMGPRASESVNRFREIFKSRYGLAPEALDINVLDPTNPSSWPGRVAAVANSEKYNTIGGNKWLERTTYEKNPTVWQFDSQTGALREAEYRSVLGTQEPPPPLTKQDVAGFFSDNTRFRDELAKHYKGQPEELILKQAKYDLRNASEFGLAGGKFTAEERALMEAAALARKGQLDEALRKYANAIGADASTEAGRQAVMQAYLENMNALTEKMGKQVIATHLDEIAKAGARSESLVVELAGTLNNLPPDLRSKLVKELSHDVTKANTLRQASALADTLATEASLKSAFDEIALKQFGKSYEALTPAEKVMVTNMAEKSASMLPTIAKGAAVTLVGVATVISIHQAYQEEAKNRGTGYGVAAGIGRGILDLFAMGYPPLAVAELAGRAAAIGISLGIDAYKMDVLNKLYDAYQRTGNIDDVLNDAEFQKYFAGGLRVFRNELREAAAKEGKSLSDADLDKAIRQYFVERAQIEREVARVNRQLVWAEAFVTSRHIPLYPGSDDYDDNSKLTEEQFRAALAQLLLTKMAFEQMLRADGVPFTKQDILWLLFTKYRGTPQELEAKLNQLYRNFGKTYPPGKKISKTPKGTTSLSDGKTSPTQAPVKGVQILHGKGAQVIVGNKEQPPCSPGQLLAGSGSFKEHPVDAPCDPPIFLGATELSCSGEILASIHVGKPVPQTWSLYNSNTGLSIQYQPRLGGKLGTVTELMALSGREGDTSATVKVPGPGKLSAWALAPRGAGPLSGSCFEQSFTAKVELTKPNNVIPANERPYLQVGDTLRTENWSPASAVLATRHGERLTVGKGTTEVRLGENRNGTSEFIIQQSSYNGVVRYTHRNDGNAQKLTTPSTIRDGNYVITPNGTDLSIRHYDQTTFVLVMEGSARVASDDGFTTTIASGQRLNLSTRGVDSPEITSSWLVDADGILPEQTLAKADPVAYGSIGAHLYEGRVEPGWQWIDANSDCRIAEGDSSATLQITVPPNNELARNYVSAPMLLHAVTGDFDLEGTVDVQTTATDNALTFFVVHQPGGILGYHGNQRDADSYAGQFWTLGGLQLIRNRWELTTLETDPNRSHFETSPTAIRLKLSRRGNLWRSYASVDEGQSWHLLHRTIMDAAPTVYAGWVFQRAAYDRLQDTVAQFRVQDVRLDSAALGSMPVGTWDVVALAGAASADDSGIIATVTDSQVGQSRMETAAPLEGDFDLVGEYEILSWRRAPYEAASFIFYVTDTSY
jgi:superoxide dismutase